MIPDFKTCLSCKIEKPSTEFYVKSSEGVNRLSSLCKICSRQRYKDTQPDRDFCECGSRKMKKSLRCQKCANKSDASLTLGETMLRYSKHHRSTWYSLVRYRARSLYSVQGSKCQNCQYDRHIEVCHIKPISEFSEDTLIDDINTPDNILILCPNCHWEFDNGELSIDEIGRPGNAPGPSL